MIQPIIHAIKKLLRISILLLVVLAGTVEVSASCTTSCNNQLNVSLDASGYALIEPLMTWQGGYTLECFPLLDSVVVEIAGSAVVVQNVTLYGHTISTSSALLDCSFTGQNVAYSIVKYYTNGTVNSCWGNVLIEDYMLPNIACADLEINCTDNSAPYQLVNNYANAVPTVSDNCGTANLTYTDSEEDYNCGNPLFLKKITRSWTVTDASGNQNTCTQYIHIKKVNGDNIQFPINQDGISAPPLLCPNPNLNPSSTGYPTLNGLSLLDYEICKFLIIYQDLQINTCGGSYKVIRKWTILDECTSEIFTHNQVIEVADETAPVIICPTISEVGSTTSSCSGNANLPPAIITDACSNFSVTTQTPNGIINGNGGTVIGLPLGSHVITYIAEDECGNISSCSTTITVVDNVAPVAICDQDIIVSLINDGTATVFASTFDDGSYDNCGVVNYEVRRMGNSTCIENDDIAFDNQVKFSCCDIGATVMVELRVTDAAGNTNYCMIDVEVQDKLNPIIICPLNITLNCESDYTDLALTGEATATDNCSISNLTHQDIVVNIDQCGVGSVSRVWTATDAQGRTSSCIQTIYLVNNNVFDENDFTFPIDYNTSDCGGGDLSPENLPAPYDQPIINNDACDLVGVSHEDLVLQIAAPACFKILRTWTIIDWCQYDPNYVGQNGETPGRWTHVQVIKVTDNIAPVFTACSSDLFIDNFEENCGETYVTLQTEATDCSAELTYTYAIDSDNDGSIEVTGIGNDASGNYSNGTHNIIFTATDGCGNSSDCSFLFTVKDAKKPTPICYGGLATVVMPSAGMVSILATDFETGSSYDNCTAYNDLKISFSSDVNDTQRNFTCDEIGTQELEIWVTDEEGNQDFCTTSILINDNGGACTPISAAVIEGFIENEEGERIENVTIQVEGDTTFSVMAGADGVFVFPDFPMGNTYIITPEKDINYLNGVSTYDLVLISKHILGTQLLNSPYKIIAADANNSKSLTALDIVKLRALILHINDSLSNNTSWKFVDADFVFTNPANPFLDNFPEMIEVVNLAVDEVANFVAIKIGDVNESASPNNLLETDTRNDVATLFFEVEDVDVKRGEILTVDFKAKDFQKIMGFQFTLDFDETTLGFEEMTSQLEGLGIDNLGFTFLEKGIITVSWNHHSEVNMEDESTLFSLTFFGKNNSSLGESLAITSTKTLAESYSKTNTSALGDLEIMDVSLFFNEVKNANEGTQLLQNRPNPVNTKTTIPFRLAKAGTIILKLIDLNGKVVQVIEGNYSKGFHEINLTNIKGSGMMYYQLKTNSKTFIKKMMLF